MVLFEDCRDRRGKVLLAKGSVLSEQVLSSLRRQGKAMLLIASGEAASAEKIEADLAARKNRLEVLFRKQDFGDSQAHANNALMKYVLRYRLGASS